MQRILVSFYLAFRSKNAKFVKYKGFIVFVLSFRDYIDCVATDICLPDHEILCPKCGEAVSDSDDCAMGCDSFNCKLWWHRNCLEADEAAFADLSIMEGSCWICPSCSATIERQCAVCLKLHLSRPP